MEATEKIKEIEKVIIELKKIEGYLDVLIERFQSFKKEVSSSINFLEGLKKSARQAAEKKLDLTFELAAGMETNNLEILDKFFEQLIKKLKKTEEEIKEKRDALKEAIRRPAFWKGLRKALDRWLRRNLI